MQFPNLYGNGALHINVSYPSAPVRRAPNFASGGFSSPSQRCNTPSHVACIRDNLQVRGISPRAASYVLKSWRPGTETQYSAAWKCSVTGVIGNREILFKQI